MGEGLPWFRMYPRNWLADTRDLDNECKGVYADLIMAMYATGGPLSYEREYMIRLTGTSWRPLRRIVAELILSGKLRLARGKLSNGRVDREIIIYRKQQKARSKGGVKKASKSNINDLAGEFASSLAQTSPKLEPSETHELFNNNAPGDGRQKTEDIKKERVPLPTVARSLGGFEEWYETFPRHAKRADAERAYDVAIKRVDLHTLAAATVALATICAELPKHRRRFIPYPASWLRADGWKSNPEDMYLEDPDDAKSQNAPRSKRKDGGLVAVARDLIDDA